MTLRNCLIGLIISAILCFTAWILILLNIDPAISNWQGFLLFYLSLFFALVSLLTLVGFFIRNKFLSNKPTFAQIGISFRHSIFFSIIIIGTLILQGMKMLNWQNALLLVAGIVILEFYFMNQEHSS